MKDPADDTTGAIAAPVREPNVPSLIEPVEDDDRTVQQPFIPPVATRTARSSRPGQSKPAPAKHVLPKLDDDSVTTEAPPALRFPPPRPAAGVSPDDAPPSFTDTGFDTMPRGDARSDAYDDVESITTRGAAPAAYEDDSVTSRKPVFTRPVAPRSPPAKDAKTAISRQSDRPKFAPPDSEPKVGATVVLPQSHSVAAPPRQPTPLPPVRAPFPSGHSLPAVAQPPPPPPPLDASLYALAKKPQYGLLVGLVAFASFAIPIALYFWLHRSDASENRPPVEEDRFEHVDPARTAAPTTSASAPKRR